ncbi:MAG TPA: IPT/TIG domain-containing protein [Acidimicrobiales bacterium]|nr:IPT/TIG domain-containing protein [Acidimicrobiales bacterium]
MRFRAPVLLALVAGGLALPPAAGAAAPHLATVAPAAKVPAGSASLGAIPAAQAITVGVYLRPRDPAALAAFVDAVSERHTGYLAPGEFVGRFGPTPGTVAAVEATLRSAGLTVGGQHNLAVTATGTAAQLEAAFHTGLTRYKLPDGGTGRATTGPVALPSTVAGDVVAVSGLNDLVPLEDQVVRPAQAGGTAATGVRPQATPAGGPQACSTAVHATQRGVGGITDTAVASAYGVDGLYAQGDLAANQAVAVYELEPFAMSDIRAFDQCYFSADHTTQITQVAVDGGQTTGPGVGEAALDIENVSALAPGAQIRVYEAPNTGAGALDNYNQIVADDAAKAVTSSWALCEAQENAYYPGSIQAENYLFEQAAAQGQSVFSSAGDDGNDDCANHGSSPVTPQLSVGDPASQPDVIGVGGTTAVSTAQPPTERVWNDGSTAGATGGGISSFWTMAPWQAASTVPGVHNGLSTPARCAGTTNGTGNCREVPDVAAFSDEFTGITIYWSGRWLTIGGTSSAAPIWASLLAEVSTSPACGGNPSTTGGVGFVAPLLYDVAATPTRYATDFNDVTVGNNDVFANQGGRYPATAGYDMTTGLGTPALTTPTGGPALAADLCDAAAATSPAGTGPAVGSVTPPSGTVAGGNTVTIHGNGLTGVTSVHFGTVAATTVHVTGTTTLTAKAPHALAVAGSPLPDGAGPALVTVSRGDGRTSRGVLYQYVSTTASTPTPTVTGVGPTGGPTAGGNTVSVYGAGFTAVVNVTFGGVPGTLRTVTSPNQLTVTVPPVHPQSCATAATLTTVGLCQVQVVVTNANGSSQTTTILPPVDGAPTTGATTLPVAPAGTELAPAPTEYDYAAAPVVQHVTNLTGTEGYSSASGGTTVQIVGKGFNWLTMQWVTFGTPDATTSLDYSVESTTSLTTPTTGPFTAMTVQTIPDATTPTGAAVVAASLGVQTLGGFDGGYRWHYAAVPTVTGLSTAAVPASGGATLTITGRGFTGAATVELVNQNPNPGAVGTTSVVFGNFTVTGPTTVTAATPAAVPGTYDVEVCTPSGCSPPGPTLALYEAGRPAVTGVVPASGPVAGGTTIVIDGVNLAGGTVTVGGVPATDVGPGPAPTQPGATSSLTAVTPPAAHGGTVPVTVTNGGGTSAATSAGMFTYTTPPAPGPRYSSYLIAGADGGIFTGNSPFYGSMGGATLAKPVVGLAASAAGYWEVASDGGIFAFGDAGFYGSMGGKPLNRPVVGIAATPDGVGYWMVAADGGVFAFGDAGFSGSPAGLDLKAPIVAIV